MIYSTENQLLKDIKDNKLFNLYLFYGSEGFLMDKYAEKIAKANVHENQNFNITNFDGQEVTPKDIWEVVDKFPFFSDKRVIIISDPKQNEIIASSDMKEILSDIPEFSTVIIKVKNSEFNPKKNKTQGNFVKLCDKYGAVYMFGEKNETDLSKFIMTLAKREKCVITRKNAQLLAELCGGNMQKISTELAKLTAYVIEGEISEEIIEDLTVPTVEAQIYDLSKAIQRGSLEKSLKILDKLFYLKEEPIMVLSTLCYYYADLYKAVLSKENKISPADSADFFGYRAGDFRIKNSFADCGKYSKKYLSSILEILAQADLSLKSSALDSRIVLEKAVIEIFSARKDK